MFKPKGLSYFEIDISDADTLFYTTDDQVEKAIIELLSERSDSQIRYTYNSHETVWSIPENIHENKLIKQLQNYGN